MTPADAAELLTLAAAFDRRKIGDADAIAWADALTGLSKADCAAAIRGHFQESTEYLMPVHVRQGVRKLRADRIRQDMTDPAYPGDADPRQITAIIRAHRRSIADGHPPAREQIEPKRDVAKLLASSTFGTVAIREGM